MGDAGRGSYRGDEEELRPEVRWTLGCLVGATAIVGVLILVFVVALVLQPAVWVQVVLGVALAVGGVLFAWLIASALGQARTRDGGPGPRPAPDPGARKPSE